MRTVARPYSADDRDLWDGLVGRSRSQHFLFLRDYMDYHADRFEDASLLVFDDGELVALLPANRSGSDVVSHGGLTFGGVLADGSMTANGMLRAFDAILAHLRSRHVERLVYKPVPHPYHLTPGDDDLYAVFRAGGELIGRDLSSAIRLDRRLPYTKGRRSSLKRARGTGVRVESSVDFVAFATVLETSLERHDATPTHSAEELALLASRFPANITLHVALDGSELLAGVVVYWTPVLAHTQYIASTLEGRRRGAVDLLIDTLIDRAAAANLRWFEFGISTVDTGAMLNSGLIRNKESYGARSVVYDRYLIRT